MEKVDISLKMEVIMLDNGKIIKLVVLVNFFSQIKSFNILENGIMINLVVGVLNMQNKDKIGKNIKENFKME